MQAMLLKIGIGYSEMMELGEAEAVALLETYATVSGARGAVVSDGGVTHTSSRRRRKA